MIPMIMGFHSYDSRRKISSVHPSNRLYLQDSSNEADIDALRKSLEKTWNALKNTSTDTHIPANAIDAANDAADSLARSLDKKMLKNPYTANIFLIQLLLPSLDITSGKNVYDEVATADFCIELSKAIHEKKALGAWYNHKKDTTRSHNVAIFVRDDKVVKSIEKILMARGKLDSTSTFKNAHTTNPITDTTSHSTQIYDDFYDATSSQIFDFNTPSLNIVPSSRFPNITSHATVRLTSLFGDQRISNGPDMTNDIVKVISNQRISEDIILIICPTTPSEMIAVRKLIQDYGNKKIILLFNEKLDPWPRELNSCEVIYSILPLTASSTDESRPLRMKIDASDAPVRTMKLVLMRKVEDWELFIDVDGEGFQKAGAVSAQYTDKKGPSMEWIATQVKEYIKKL